jgi:predicted membrane protein
MDDRTGNSKRIITGGLILITLGVLIYLHSHGDYSLGRSWPILLIVIALGTLIQSPKDMGGWIIGAIGVLFLFKEVFNIDFSVVGIYVLPLLLIILGVAIIAKHARKRKR